MEARQIFRQIGIGMRNKNHSEAEGVSQPKKSKTGAKIILGILILGFAVELVYLNSEQQATVQTSQTQDEHKKPTRKTTKLDDLKIAQTYPFWINDLGATPEDQNDLSDKDPSIDSIKMNLKNAPRSDIPDLPNTMPLPSPSNRIIPAIPPLNPNKNQADLSNKNSKEVSVTGIILDHSGDDSVAIISDGAVVKVGQKYNGNTVTSINETGVSLEDGSRMNYK